MKIWDSACLIREKSICLHLPLELNNSLLLPLPNAFFYGLYVSVFCQGAIRVPH